MIKLTYTLLLSVFMITSVFSEGKGFYIKKSLPQWVEVVQYERLLTKNREDEEGVSYLLLDNQQNLNSQEIYSHTVYEINNETGIQNHSDLWVSYDPSYQELIFHKLTIYRKNKEYNRLIRSEFKIIQNESQLESKIYQEKYSAGIYIKDVQVGDIIEYSYTIKGKNPIFGKHFFDSYSLEYYAAVNKAFLKMTYPKDQPLHYKLIKSTLKPKQYVSGDNIVLKWEQSYVEEIVTNSELPSWYNSYGYVQYSTMSEWKELIDWASALFPDKDISGSKLERTFNKITKDLVTETEKINALLRFVQEEIRYVGIEVDINNYKPYPPSKVFENRFGDCKDKSYLLVTLLHHMGIEAYPAFVNTSLKQEVSNHLPSPTVFNHVIVAIKRNGKLVFVDPTIPNQRGNYYNLYNGNYQKALVLSKQYDKLVEIENNSIEKIEIQEDIRVVNSTEAAKFSVKSKYFGGEADNIRGTFKRNTPKELESSYLNFYSIVYPNMRLMSDFEVVDDSNENIINTKEEYEIDNFWTYDSTSSVNDYYCELRASNLLYYITSPDQKNRKMPFSIYHPIEIDNKITLHHANDISLERKNGEIVNNSFRFTYNLRTEGNKVILDYHYKSLKDYVATSELDKYYKDYNAILDLTWFTFTYGGDNNMAGGMRINWLFVILVLFFITILIYVANLFYKKDIITPESKSNEPPLPIGGWLILPMIGIIISPFILIYNSYDFFNQTSWEYISSVSSEAYNSFWSIAFVLGLMMNVLFFTYTIFLFILFIKKRTIFPIHYISFRIINLVFVILDYYLTSQIESSYIVENSSGYQELVKAVGSAAIWIPYMFYSERVKNTFVNTYKKLKSEDDEYLEGLKKEYQETKKEGHTALLSTLKNTNNR